MEIWDRLTKELSQSSPLDLLVKLLAALVLLGLVYLVKLLWSLAWPRLKLWWLTKKRLLARLERGLRAVAQADHGAHVSEGKGVWLTKPIEPGCADEKYRAKLLDSIPIWVFANNKGGVAKTTDACNLAAHYAMEAQKTGGKPVLLLDVDYQGSGSSMGAKTLSVFPGRPTTPEQQN